MESASLKILTLIKQGLSYSVGNFLNKLLLFLMVPLYARYILPADLSLLEILDPAEQFIFGVFTLGMVHGFYRFYSRAKNHEERSQVISTVFWFFLVLSSLLCSLLYIFDDAIIRTIIPDHPLARTAYYLTLVSLFLRFMMMVSSGYYNANERAGTYSFWNVSGTVIFCGLNFYFIVVLHEQIDSVFISRIFLLLPLAGAGIFSFRKYLSFQFDRELLKRMLLFSYPFILAAASQPILTYIDRWMLSLLDSAASTGIYGLSYRFGMIPGMILVTPFLKAWWPFIFNYDDEETQNVVYKRIILYYTFAGLFLWLGLSVFSSEIIYLLTSEEYYSGHIIIPYVASSQLLFGLGWIVIAGLAVQEKTFFIGICTFLAAVVNIILNYYLIPRYGMLGAAYATLGAFVFLFAGYTAYSRYKIPMKWPVTRMTGMLIISISAYYLCEKLFPENKVLLSEITLYKTGIISFTIGILAYLAKINIKKLTDLKQGLKSNHDRK